MAATPSLPSVEVDVGPKGSVNIGSTEAQKPKTFEVKGEDNVHKAAYVSGWRYWTVIAALSVTALLPAMEGTVVSTALPSIIQDLHGGELYVWVVNSYFLTR